MTSPFTRRQLISGATAIGAMAALPSVTDAAARRTTLLREVRLVDGTGAPSRLADVLVMGDRIAAINPPSAARTPTAFRTISGEGRVLAPGFIDSHAHGDPLQQSYESFLAMGVTTLVLGQDGGGPSVVGQKRAERDLRNWMRAIDGAKVDVNVATLSGHGALRHAARIPDSVRRPDEAALQRMTALLDAELGAGSFGLSYGLEYVPGIFSETAELTRLGRSVSRVGGVVMSHMRSENDEEINASIDELIASSLPARPHISHLKVIFGKGEARARALLAFIANKRRQGIDLTADAYPYTAGYTGVAVLFPEWALPPADYDKIVAERRQALRDYLEKKMIRRGGPEALLFGTPPYAGKTVAQAAKEAGLEFPDFLIKIGPGGGAGAHFFMDQALQDTLLLDPFVAIGTDGAPGVRHPRSTGTYAKWIEKYVVSDARLPLEEAIRKASGLPAQILRLPDRGVIRVGAKADLNLFDPARVKARSSYVEPFAMAEGFDLVMVNGAVAFEGGARRERAGRMLRAKRSSPGGAA